jgi:hypothetical protein
MSKMCLKDQVYTKKYVHVLKNLTSLASESTRVVEVLIGGFQLFSLTTHLTESFIPNLFGRSTQPDLYTKREVINTKTIKKLFFFRHQLTLATLEAILHFVKLNAAYPNYRIRHH